MSSSCVLSDRKRLRGILVCCILTLALAVTAGNVRAQSEPASLLEPPTETRNFTAIAPGVSTPPDTNGAAGPNHLLLATNGTVRVHDRAGNELSSINLLSFWSGMGVTDVFDPRSFFDPHSQRFILITCADRRSATSAMLLAVSATDDPTGAWHRWKLDADPADTDWVDYANLGFTSSEVTFTGNMFTIAEDNFTGVRFWRLDKASALDGGPLVMEGFRVTGAGGTLVPVVTFDASESTQYIIRTGTSNLMGQGRMQLYALSGPLGASNLDSTPYGALGDPWSISIPDAPQAGSSALIETNDDRVLSAVYQDGRIWCAHTVGLPVGGVTHAAAKWWEVMPPSGEARQDGVLEGPEGMNYYFPSLVVNDQGMMVLGSSGSSAEEFVSVYYAWRSPDNALGALDGVRQYHAGAGPYTGPRWGDYSGVFLDPVDGTSVWVLQQYAEESNRWGIQWLQLTSSGGQSNALPASSVWALVLLSLCLFGGGWLAIRRFHRP